MPIILRLEEFPAKNLMCQEVEVTLAADLMEVVQGEVQSSWEGGARHG